MFKNFKIRPMFKDQVHERNQFKLNVEGKDYQGLFHNGEIHWFNPHPNRTFEESHVEAIESQVHGLMADHLK
ncbi:hypothetical protein A8F94_15455 [Bacillus sp. FJAT-27225]|uniref:DUF5342 family protein n=1 Tax=Bacillus sp. FJAT-27225 TaxID=1743144 RepID=UPI00080C34A4|nr:DUF5342 family protein [Bacillus sp. FJAT-27225]OCA84118.1 hypothetical protein A8F94_15455 [Bacillus sp. FJAT-27225]